MQGGSNGGLLMGAFLTQRPELARAVVSHVGIYDMLRVELDPNGQFNVTEFGTVKDPEQFKALYAYSPYHHVKRRGRNIPAVLLTTGENDGRVNPAQSRKMAAAAASRHRLGSPGAVPQHGQLRARHRHRFEASASHKRRTRSHFCSTSLASMAPSGFLNRILRSPLAGGATTCAPEVFANWWRAGTARELPFRHIKWTLNQQSGLVN